MRKPESMKRSNQKVSLYDMETPVLRKGIAGWKLTKRPLGGGTLDGYGISQMGISGDQFGEAKSRTIHGGGSISENQRHRSSRRRQREGD